MNGKKLPQEKVDNILEAIYWAPTSKGLQAFKVFVIEDRKLRDEIFKVAAPGQPQIPNASHVLVFASYLEINDEVVDNFIQLVRNRRPMLTEVQISELRQSMTWIT
ncbi:MAG: nitroreductase family protein, partial [Pigmentiphaga sp.]|nr:nitroreductase family protein [Pigmentiphaga sp.]